MYNLLNEKMHSYACISIMYLLGPSITKYVGLYLLLSLKASTLHTYKVIHTQNVNKAVTELKVNKMYYIKGSEKKEQNFHAVEP